MEQYIGWLIGAVLIIGLAVVGVRSLAPRVIGAWTRLLLPADQRAVFHHKAKLLENTVIVEFVAPSIDFQREYGEDEKRRKPVAWLTPWPNAVKASWKKHKGSARYVDVRAQLRTAAHELVVSVLPDERQPANASDDHFFVLVPLGNRSEEDVMKLRGLIKGKLGLHSVEAGLAEGNLDVEFVCHAVKPTGRLETMKIGVDFLDANPAPTPVLLPVAARADGTPWSLPLLHCLVYGVTRSGKGSVLNAITRQLSPFVRQGYVELWGIDLKMEDLDKYRLSGLFEIVATEQDVAEDTIRRFYAVMKDRQRERQAARAEGRAPAPIGTRENPYMVLEVDEFSSFLEEANAPERRGSRDVMTKFTQIMQQAAGGGMFVIAAGQNIDKDLLKRLRTNFVVVVCLHAENEHYNDTLLGAGAMANGYDAVSIPQATLANGYRTAGLGYVKEESGEPVMVKFAYSDDDDVQELAAAFPRTFEEVRPSVLAVPERVAKPAPVALAPVVEQPPEKPTPVRNAPRSQVDELIAVKEFDDAKLARARERVAAKLEQGDSVKGRALLDAIEAELRIRARLAQYAPVKPQPLDDALPPLNF